MKEKPGNKTRTDKLEDNGKTSPESRPETSERQGGHSIRAKVGDKLG